MAGPAPLKIGEEVETLEWRAGDEPGQAAVGIDGRKYDVRYRFVDEGQILLQVNGRTVQVFVAGDQDRRHVSIAGQTFLVEVPRMGEKRRGRPGSADEPEEVTAPMPAVVVRLLVREGETVVKGQGLLVVSAMKMETTLKAPRDGVVRKINTALQAKVMPEDRLVEIEEAARP
jgi:3-methylcrotonyl-CoA carboxylase alpha subunit